MNRCTTLLIEDNPGDARLIREMLSEAGGEFVVTAVDHLAAGLKELHEKPTDVLLLDLNLPDSQGLATFSRVRAEFPELPVVILTGLRDSEVALRAVSGGAQDYLVKGEISPSALLRALRYGIERKRAEQALSAERARFFAVLEQLPMMVCLLTQDYHVAFANRAFRDRFGESRGRNCFEFCFGLTAPCEFCETFEVLKTGQPHHWQVNSPDGSVIDVHDVPFTDLDGSRMVLEVDVDITEAKRAEKAKARLAAIVESSDDAIVAKTLDGIVESWNRGAERLYGYPAEEIVGRSVAVLLPPDRPGELHGILQRIGRGERVEHCETQRARKDGRLIDVSLTASPLRDAAGKIIGASTIARDITERKRAERALRLSEERYRSLTAATAQLVWTANAKGLVAGDIPSWRAFTGQAEEEVQGWGWADALHPEDRQRAVASWAKALETGSLYEAEYRIRRKDGEYRTVAARAVPVLETDGRVREWVGSCSDITERQRAEEEIRQLNASLERRVAERTAELAAANQELEAFSYSVAHDLRAPLRSVDGFTAALLEDHAAKLDEEGQHCARRIRDSALRMSQLIEDLLNLSRISRSEVHKQKIDLSALARSVASDLQQSDPQRTAEFVIQPCLETDGDPRLLRVALENLLGNAWKFSARRCPARIAMGLTEQNGRKAYFVRDNGAGFDMAYVGKIFAPFQRLHSTKEFPGTGIGLATVARIVRKHRGEVWAEGAVDRGATFYFTLGEAVGSSGAES